MDSTLLDVRFECVLERFLIQENIGILELFIEAIFHLLHAADHAVQVAVPC